MLSDQTHYEKLEQETKQQQRTLLMADTVDDVLADYDGDKVHERLILHPSGGPSITVKIFLDTREEMLVFADLIDAGLSLHRYWGESAEVPVAYLEWDV